MFCTRCRKVDHFKVADRKKQTRQQRERQQAMQRRRVLYPILFLAAIIAGLLLARYSGVCSALSRQLLLHLHARRAMRKRRPYALAAISSSPRSSPKGSPASSPTVKGASSSSSISLGNGRATQQRQAALHLMTGTRKPGRLHQ